jgi:hypothetical protein
MREEEYQERLRMIESMLKYGVNKTIVKEALDSLNQDINHTEYVFDLKCDYCDEEIKGITRIPKEWLKGRMRKHHRQDPPATEIFVTPSIECSEYIAVTACPEHKRQLNLLTKEN